MNNPSRFTIMMAMAVALAMGCDRENTREDLSPTERAFATGTKRVARSHAAALEESEDQQRYTVVARHNPGRCGAPSFEVYVRGAWTRAALLTKDQALGVRLVNFEEQARGRVDATMVITGAFDSRPARATNGVEWPAFEIEAILETDTGTAARSYGSDPSLACASSSSGGSTP